MDWTNRYMYLLLHSSCILHTCIGDIMVYHDGRGYFGDVSVAVCLFVLFAQKVWPGLMVYYWCLPELMVFY